MLRRSWCLLAGLVTVPASAAPPEAPALVRVVGEHDPVRVEVDRDVLAGLERHDVVGVELEPGRVVHGLITADRRGADAWWWTGPLLEERGWLAIAASGDVVYGDVRLDDGTAWRVRAGLDGAGATAERIEAGASSGCSTALAGGDEPAYRDIGTGGGHYCGDGAATIDLMVVYTTAAREGQGGFHGIQALIALAEATTNLALASSEIDTRVRIVKTYEPKYPETGNPTVDLHFLTDPDDDELDEIHAMRDAVGADVVSMIVHEMVGACGEAFFSIGTGNVPLPQLGFNVVKAECAVDNLVFAHELGHNLGCRHDRDHDPSPGAFSFSHGRHLPDGLGTVMAVGPFGVQRVPHFSNPEVAHGGVPTGVKIGQPDSADNAESIRRTAFNVANFRCADCNGNGVSDVEDVSFGGSVDCNGNGVPDECDIAAGVLADCDGDGRGDQCVIASEMGADCNGNGRLDACDVAEGSWADLDGNGVPDACEDCNDNGLPDGIDIAVGASADCDGDGRPDECELPTQDCNANGVVDGCDIAGGASLDLDGNGVPDECEDCNGNGLPDGLELGSGTSTDCDANGLPDECDVAAGSLTDGDGDGLADECDAVVNETAGTRHLTIQLAVDLAAEGDIVTVAPGRYAQHVDLLGKALTLRGTGGAGATVLDGAGLDEPVVACVGGEGPSTVVEGFTITGGADSGIACVGSSPLVVGCVIAGNTAPASGGGVRCQEAAGPTLVNCVLRDNAAQIGGGLYAFGGSPRLINCTLAGNAASVIGGPLFSIGGGQPWLSGCVVWGNAPVPLQAADARVTFSDVEGGWRGEGGENVEANPLFVDPERGDLRPGPGSPCIDAGDNGPLPAWATHDVAGAPRIVDDPATPDTGAAAGARAVSDMGAHEHQPAPPPRR